MTDCLCIDWHMNNVMLPLHQEGGAHAQLHSLQNAPRTCVPCDRLTLHTCNESSLHNVRGVQAEDTNDNGHLGMVESVDARLTSLAQFADLARSNLAAGS